MALRELTSNEIAAVDGGTVTATEAAAVTGGLMALAPASVAVITA